MRQAALLLGGRAIWSDWLKLNWTKSAEVQNVQFVEEGPAAGLMGVKIEWRVYELVASELMTGYLTPGK